MPSALTGLRVLDFTHMPPGMYTTMFLADLGADVLRIERPLQGEDSSDASNFEGYQESMSLPYEAFNRNKRSMTLNLKTKAARKIVDRLVQNSDIILEGFRPGVAQRIGLGYDALKTINPRLIYCSMSGYGQDGPYCELPGHDVNYISVAGAQDMIGQRNGPHAIPMNFLADWAGAGLNAVIGILAAVIARQGTGRGQYVDISYTDGVLSLVTAFAYEYFINGMIYRRGEAFYNGGFPAYNIYQSKDGKYVSIGCFEPWFWENLCKLLGREDFIPYEFDEGEKREEIRDYFEKAFLTKTRDEWFDFLKDKDIPVAKVYSIDEVFTDPQVVHRRMLIEVDHPIRGKVKQVGSPIKLSDTPAEIISGAPLPGQHTAEVLAELGYTEAEISTLKKQGTIP